MCCKIVSFHYFVVAGKTSLLHFWPENVIRVKYPSRLYSNKIVESVQLDVSLTRITLIYDILKIWLWFVEMSFYSINILCAAGDFSPIKIEINYKTKAFYQYYCFKSACGIWGHFRVNFSYVSIWHDLTVVLKSSIFFIH